MKLLTTDEKALLLSMLQSKTRIVDSCWIYQGFKYGVHYRGLRFNGQRVLSHRVSAAIYLGLDLDNTDIQANHKNECKYKSCWNPDHLYIGTQAQNMKDLSEVMRAENRICKICGATRTLINTTSRGKRIKRLECNSCRKRRYHKDK